MTPATEAAARVRAYIDALEQCDYDSDEIDYIVVDDAEASLTVTDLRALLDAHDAQAAEIARLTAEMQSGSFYQEKDIDAMQAEIARLRAALNEQGARNRTLARSKRRAWAALKGGDDA